MGKKKKKTNHSIDALGRHGARHRQHSRSAPDSESTAEGTSRCTNGSNPSADSDLRWRGDPSGECSFEACSAADRSVSLPRSRGISSWNSGGKEEEHTMNMRYRCWKSLLLKVMCQVSGKPIWNDGDAIWIEDLEKKKINQMHI